LAAKEVNNATLGQDATSQCRHPFGTEAPKLHEVGAS